MELQEVLLIAIFSCAVFYIIRVVYRSLKPGNGCSSGCGKCGADFSNNKLPEFKK